MDEKRKKKEKREGPKRVLGDEWVDWNGENHEDDTTESGMTFLVLSLIVLSALILIGFLFLYLVLPRFELFGSFWATVITLVILGTAALLILWYLLVLFNLLLKKRYFDFCLGGSNRLIFFLLPYVSKLASLLGISNDRLSHSFILLNNKLLGAAEKEGSVLALLPRCLRKDLLAKVKEICDQYPGVVYHIAPGGTVARKIVRDISPRSIIAVACERDLLSGIMEISGKIPVIGIPNKRPLGPCKDTVIDLENLRAALDYFQNDHSR